jgi:AraC family transcriptional regulator
MDEPKFETRKGFTVVGLKYRGKNDKQQIPQLWRRLTPRFDQINNIVVQNTAYGVMGNMDNETGDFDYLAGFETKNTDNVPDGMSTWSLPEQTYAIFFCTLPTLMVVLDHIYGSWLPESKYQRADGPEFELYDEKFDPQDDKSLMYLYIPVK